MWRPESVERLLGSGKLSQVTKEDYLRRVMQYLRTTGQEPDQFVKAVRSHPKRFEETFIRFLQQTSTKSSASTTASFRDSMKRFLELNRVTNIKWEYVNEFVPSARKAGQDRAPTLEEIRRIVDVADLRMKCVVLFLCSSGARIGSVQWLKWQDVEEVEVEDKKFAQVTIYKGEPEEYVTFISPECYGLWLEYKELRESIGERIAKSSFVFTTQGNARRFDQSRIRPTSVKTLKNQLGELLQRLGMRLVISEREGYKNYEFKQAHGFRKFFKTRMEVAGVKPLVVETLMGHNTGVSKSYYKPTREELATEYAKAIDELTIIRAKQTVTQDMVTATFNRGFLLNTGYTEEEINGLGDLSQLTQQQMQDLIRQKQMQSLGLNGNHQRIVGMAEVENWVVQGWDFVTPLPDGKAIIKLPT